MVKCKNCNSEEHMEYISEIVTNAIERFHEWDFDTKSLYQCSNCKSIVVD